MSTTHPTTLSPTTHKAVLAHKLKVIDQRRAELEQLLHQSRRSDGSFKTQELETERAELLALRVECASILHPAPEPTRTPELQRLYDRQRERNKLLLRVSLRERTKQAIHDAEKLEAAGEHRQAKNHPRDNSRLARIDL